MSDWSTLDEFPVDHLPAESENWPGQIQSIQSTADGVAILTSIGDLPDSVRLVLVERSGKVHTQSGMSSYSNDKLAPWANRRSA